MSVKKKVKIINRDGIHARPSAMIVECASMYDCNVFFHKNGQKGNAKNILDLMSMAMAYGQEIELECDGKEEEEALNAVSKLFGKEFNFERE